jgi:CheY-like chemotaxis protein
VAEDNPVNQTIAVKMLQKLGLKADVAANGKEAIQRLRQQKYDLVLMDCQMPEMDGYEATALIRQDVELGQTHLPIIAMTANAMADDEGRCLKAGMDDYIPKPIAMKKFGDILYKWLQIIENREKKSA